MDLSKRIWPSKDGKEIITSNVVVHHFRLNGVDDPDLWAGEALYSWEHSEAGKWVITNAIEKPSWHKIISYDTYGYLYQIRADLTDEQITFFELKFK